MDVSNDGVGGSAVITRKGNYVLASTKTWSAMGHNISRSVAALLCALALQCYSATAQVLIFSDDFNRPNSTQIGNGWTNVTENGAPGTFVILNGELINPAVPRSGLYRPLSFDSAVRITGKVFDSDGHPSAGPGGQFEQTIAVRAESTVLGNGLVQGYGITINRNDNFGGNSFISLFDNGQVVSTAPYPGQLISAEAQFDVTFNPNGKINGSITNPVTAAKFDFSFPERQIQSTGGNFMYISGGNGFPNRGFPAINLPGLDDLVITGVAPSRPSFPPSSISPSILRASVGSAAGDLRREIDVFRNNQESIIACDGTVVDCDYDEARRVYSEQVVQRGHNIVEVAVEAFIQLITRSVTGTIVKFSDIEAIIENALDFERALQEAAPTGPSGLTDSRVESVIIREITGTQSIKTEGDNILSVYSLDIMADIAKTLLLEIEAGDTWISSQGIDVRSTGFGVFTVQEVVDPPGYNTVRLSLAQIEALVQPVSSPSALFLFVGAVLGGILCRNRSAIHTALTGKLGRA